ncbi:uncharacterized protein LOC130667154 [Microplitis mediator]|uniref:uncharacterized protein LOC130667154 n=1 Tax=Microplitis mediator TaxID=375433 RepID=UPI0025536A4C|nr:uncharacterized protein LOC130667154 [Microplitis mediator]
MSNETKQRNYINLVGFESKTLNDSKLPVNRDILCLFYYQHRTEKLIIREGAKFVLNDVTHVWNKFTLPAINSHRSILKIEKLYKDWLKTQINKSRKKSPAQISLEKVFVESLDNLFDIAPQNVLQTLNSPQKRVYIDNREILKSSQLRISNNVQEVKSTSSIYLEENANVVKMKSTDTASNTDIIDMTAMDRANVSSKQAILL